MCLIAWAWYRRPDQPLVLVANRDEQHARPAAPLGFWPEAPEICAGRDLAQGGTWLGATRTGRFAAITNFREPRPEAGERSRGHLVADFLRGEQSPQAFAAEVHRHGAEYGGYNLLLGQADGEMLHVSNRDERGPRVLAPGVYGLSNGPLDAGWPKVCTARDGLEALLAAGEQRGEAFLELMRDARPFADDELPDTGVGQSLERMLSPRFIRSPGYGTRCTTLLAIGPRRIRMLEQRYAPDGEVSGRDEFRFAWRAGGKKEPGAGPGSAPIIESDQPPGD